MEYAVRTTNLTKRFGKEIAVSGVNLQIPKGEIYGFLGPNGAGKTTTIRMLLGLMKPSSGSINIFGKLLSKEKVSILRSIGSLVENPSYYPHLTAYENLETSRKILGVPKSRIDEVLGLVRLTDSANKKVRGFSLGMKQRLGIASALLNNPELLILDEPTNGLDPSGIIEIRNLIKRLPAECGMTILISSHLLSEIDQMATVVGIISNGEMIFQDSIEMLRKHAQQNIILRSDRTQEAQQLLASKDLKADLQANQLLLHQNSDQYVAQVVQELIGNGFQVYRVEEEKRSLEDIFLEMTAGRERPL